MTPRQPARQGDRAIVIHSFAHAREALGAARDLGCPVMLMSAASGAAALGAGWWQALIRQLQAEYPDVQFTALLDCGTRADLVQSALRQGLTDLCFRGSPAGARPLGEIAERRGARLVRRRPPALDLLGVADPAAACRAWLSKTGRKPAAG